MSTETAYRLPMPEPIPGGTWVVAPETAVPWRTDVGHLRCETRGHDLRQASAGMTKRNGEFRSFCRACLAESLMWVEDGRVVSWLLSRPAATHAPSTKETP